MLIKSMIHYWTCHLKDNTKMAAEAWLPVVEDAIPLASYMPMEMVVY